MADSPTRRSSIPILKQTNKTKSFQSFVNLKIIDSQDPNGRIHSPASMTSLSPPILEFPKIPPKPQARSAAQLPKLEIDNDIVITKLCEENKRIKEHQTQLLSKYEEGKPTHTAFAVSIDTYFAYFSSVEGKHGNSKQKRGTTKGVNSCKT